MERIPGPDQPVGAKADRWVPIKAVCFRTYLVYLVDGEWMGSVQQLMRSKRFMTCVIGHDNKMYRTVEKAKAAVEAIVAQKE